MKKTLLNNSNLCLSVLKRKDQQYCCPLTVMRRNIKKAVELHYCLRVLKGKRGDQQKDVLQESLVVTSRGIELLPEALNSGLG